jgi:hypothetical protein
VDGLPLAVIRLARVRAYWLGLTAEGFARKRDGERWTLSSPFAGALPSALAASPSGRIAVGTATGAVYVSHDEGASWTAVGDPQRPLGIPIQALVLDERTEIPQIVVATDRGVAAAPLNGGAWTWRNAGLPGTDAKTGRSATAAYSIVIADDRGTLLAATSFGVYRSEPDGRWLRVPGLGVVGAVAALAGARLLAAGPGGMFSSADGGASWTRAIAASGVPHGLAAAADRAVVALGNDVYISDDGGASWEPALGFIGRAPTDVAVGLDGMVAVAAPLRENPADEWPGLPTALHGTALPLDRETALAAGDLLVLRTRDAVDVYTVRSTRTGPLTAWGLTAISTVVELDRAIDRRFENPRDVTVHLTPLTRAALPLVRQDPAPPRTALPVARALPPLEPGRTMIVEGQPPQVVIRGLAAGAALVNRTAGGAFTVAPREVAGAPLHDLDAAAPLGERGTVVARFDGVFICDDLTADPAPWRKQSAPPGRVIGLASLADVVYALVAGTPNASIFTLQNGSWSAEPELRGPFTRLVASNGRLFACGVHTLEVRDRGGWSAVDAQFETQTVCDVADAGDVMLVATEAGLIAKTPAGWRTGCGPDDLALGAVAIAAGVWYAGTRGRGVYVSRDGGRSWTPLRAERRVGDIAAMIIAGDAVIAVEAGSGLSADGRPLPLGFASTIRSVVPLATGPAAALAVLRGTPAIGGVPLRTFKGTLAFEDADLAVLDAGLLAPLFRRRLETLLGYSVATADIIVESAGAAWRIRATGPVPHLVLRREPAVLSVFVLAPIPLARPAVLAADPGAPATWTPLDPSGVPASAAFAAHEDEVWYLGADPSAPSRAETVTLAVHGESTLHLKSPLVNAYDVRTVTIAANVVAATHGQTVPADVPILSGDSSIPAQTAALRNAPLSYTMGDDGPQPNLEVWVRSATAQTPAEATASLYARAAAENGAAWSAVPSFAYQGSRARVYTVRLDAAGTTILTFGDGVNGRRLPTGTENVIARYRVGVGTGGNVPAAALVLLQRPVAGVEQIRNPIAARGGSDAEGAPELRTAIPRGRVAARRVISRVDLIDYLATWPGIAKVDVQRRRSVSGRPAFTITYLAGANDAIDVDQLLASLRGDGAATWDLAVGACRMRSAVLAARLFLGAGVDGAVVYQRAIAMLLDRFGSGARNLRDDLRLADVITALQHVPGVAAVTVQAFYERGRSPRVCETIAGDDGAAGEFASLLILDPGASELSTGDAGAA